MGDELRSSSKSIESCDVSLENIPMAPKLYSWAYSDSAVVGVFQGWAYFGVFFWEITVHKCDGFHVENENYSVVHFECIFIVLYKWGSYMLHGMSCVHVSHALNGSSVIECGSAFWTTQWKNLGFLFNMGLSIYISTHTNSIQCTSTLTVYTNNMYTCHERTKTSG